MDGDFGPDDILSAQLLSGIGHQNCGPEFHDIYGGPWDLIHSTPTEAIACGLLTHEQLEEYDCFATLREPYSRWVSQMVHLGAKPYVEEFRPATKKFSSGAADSDMKVLGKSQHSYFDTGHVQVIDFRNLDAEIKSMMERLGGHPPRLIPRLNSRRKFDKKAQEGIWTDDLRKMVRDFYPEDFVMWDKFLTAEEL